MRLVKIKLPWWVAVGEHKVLGLLSRLKSLWRIWDLRTLILLSLGLQALLILVAPFRKKTANGVVIMSVWLAYLLADYIAILALGLIPNYHIFTTTTSYTDANPDNPSAVHSDLLAFWAPFLLVHLGGPDPITALALEDNEIWMRTALHLFTYLSSTGSVFFQSLPSFLLSIPTILMFFAGFLKYLERTLSMYYARLSQLRHSTVMDADHGPNYAMKIESYDLYLNSLARIKAESSIHYRLDSQSRMRESDPSSDSDSDDSYDDIETGSYACCQGSVRTTCRKWLFERRKSHNRGGVDSDHDIERGGCCQGSICRKFRRKLHKEEAETKLNKTELHNVNLVREAYYFFDKYKGLYVDMTYSLDDWNYSRAYFLLLSPEDAFTVLAVKLNFVHEFFFTKMIVIHQGMGRKTRYFSFCFELASLMIWILFVDTQLYHPFDTWITYTLLMGAIIIDCIAFLMIFLSNHQLALLSKESEIRAFLYEKLLSCHKRTWGGCSGNQKTTHWQRIRRVCFRRWSEEVSQFNLVEYSVDLWRDDIHSLISFIPPMKAKLEEYKYVSTKWFADDLRDFIFNELKYKAGLAGNPREAAELSNHRGSGALCFFASTTFDPSDYYKWIEGIEYDESLLIWHVATQLLYQQWKSRKWDGDKEEEKYGKYSKTFSDYMIYLLKWQRGLMSTFASATEARMRDTCIEATIFMNRMAKLSKGMTKEERVESVCERMMKVQTETRQRSVNNAENHLGKNKSVLHDAVCLAKKLMKDLGEKERNSQLAKKVMEDDGKERKEGMWELIAKVWVELLGYSATHCRASAHAAQLKQGGELLTFVWLLMVHFGLGNQFNFTEDRARTPLIPSRANRVPV